MVGALIVATDEPVPKDVVIAIAGAAAALGGLILVFLGVIVASYSSYGGETDEAVLRPYKRAAGAILGVFALSLVSAALAIIWLATGGGGGALYLFTLWTFFALLLAVFLAALGTVFRVALG